MTDRDCPGCKTAIDNIRGDFDSGTGQVVVCVWCTAMIDIDEWRLLTSDEVRDFMGRDFSGRVAYAIRTIRMSV